MLSVIEGELEGTMDENAHTPEEIAEQAIHDRSVIDHVVHAFSLSHSDRSPRTPIREKSAEIYHRIRRTWPEQVVTRPAAFLPYFD